ncbi:MAG: flagellar hook-associated protein FlgL, partial [Candidatus Hydrogenedens sp.]
MGIIRVTSRMLVDRTLTDLAYQTRRILSLQEQLSSGQRVNRPSDDPLNARRAISAQSMIAQNEQYIKNITTIRPYLNETETTITTTLDIVQRARELAIQGRNTTNAQLQRDQIATEVNQLIEALLKEANHLTNGRYIFGGTVTISAPFQEARNANGEITSVAYTGNNDYISVEIMEGTQVITNQTGREVFLSTSSQSTDIFQTLISLRDDLRSANFTGIEQRIQQANYAISQLSLALS